MSRLLLSLSVPLALAAPAGAQTPRTPAGPRPHPAAGVIQADRALAEAIASRGLESALRDALAESATVLVEGAPVVTGRQHALALLVAQPQLARLRVRPMMLVATISGDGGFGVSYGNELVSARGAAGDSAPRVARYINVWRRMTDSSWKIVARVDAGLLAPDSAVLPASIAELPPARSDLLLRPMRDFATADASFARMAGEQGAPAAFGHWAAADGVTFGPGSVINIGPASIRESFAASPASQALWKWAPVVAGASADGTLAFTIGEASIKPPGVSDADAFLSKYLTVWRRQPDGSIRYIVDAGNSRPALTR